MATDDEIVPAGVTRAESEARKSDSEFVRDVLYFHKHKGDVSRFGSWSEERCKHLMPAFHEAWRQELIYGRLALLALEDAASKYPA